MKRASIVAAVIAALALAACGGSDDATTPAGEGGSPSTQTSSPAGFVDTISMVDNAFEPADATVGNGDLELVNDGEALHNFTIEGTDVNVDVEAGEDAHATIDLDAGTYTIFCEFHRAQGMEGAITVA